MINGRGNFDLHGRSRDGNSLSVVDLKEIAGYQGIYLPTNIRGKRGGDICQHMRIYNYMNSILPYIFKNNGALRACPISLPNSRHTAARVRLEQRCGSRTFEGICLDVLIRLAFGLEGNPDTMGKGAACDE